MKITCQGFMSGKGLSVQKERWSKSAVWYWGYKEQAFWNRTIRESRFASNWSMTIENLIVLDCFAASGQLSVIDSTIHFFYIGKHLRKIWGHEYQSWSWTPSRPCNRLMILSTLANPHWNGSKAKKKTQIWISLECWNMRHVQENPHTASNLKDFSTGKKKSVSADIKADLMIPALLICRYQIFLKNEQF